MNALPVGQPDRMAGGGEAILSERSRPSGEKFIVMYVQHADGTVIGELEFQKEQALIFSNNLNAAIEKIWGDGF